MAVARTSAMEPHDPIDLDSTLIRSGRDAVTISDMAAFVEALNNRPIIKLLEELPDLARLSESKFALAMTTLRRRFRSETEVDQAQLRAFANEIAAAVPETGTADRIRQMFSD